MVAQGGEVGRLDPAHRLVVQDGGDAGAGHVEAQRRELVAPVRGRLTEGEERLDLADRQGRHRLLDRREAQGGFLLPRQDAPVEARGLAGIAAAGVGFRDEPGDVDVEVAHRLRHRPDPGDHLRPGALAGRGLDLAAQRAAVELAGEVVRGLPAGIARLAGRDRGAQVVEPAGREQVPHRGLLGRARADGIEVRRNLPVRVAAAQAGDLGLDPVGLALGGVEAQRALVDDLGILGRRAVPAEDHGRAPLVELDHPDRGSRSLRPRGAPARGEERREHRGPSRRRSGTQRPRHDAYLMLTAARARSWSVAG
ncbi:hypothetical protein [Methylobacterium sp. CB376]|uniref:hypothetical protein n=1 Tax=Methylobacterium sp. CB376 TaxID=3138063 RepID=UPI00405351C5